MTRRLAALRVGNFKAFADTQRIPLKPITLIFGPNSAGKSSFIHSLVLAHEAQFGREKRSLARLDVHHADVGGTAIDLGGFRQYVHRSEARRRVEWGAELAVGVLDGRLAQLLAPLKAIAISIAIGIELDDQDRPVPGADPRVEAVDLSGDGQELMHMSRRRTDAHGSVLRLDRLALGHAVFRQVINAIIESATTTEMRQEDYAEADEAIGKLLPELQIRIDHFFPVGIDLPKTEAIDPASSGLLFPVSKGNRRDDIAQALRFYLPRTLNELIKGVFDSLTNELGELQYLGPLRSFPPRHLAFAEHEDANWYAGGGYAWDVVRRDDKIRETVNAWLGSDKLKTPYELMVRSLVAVDQMYLPIEIGLQHLEEDGLDLEPVYDDDSASPSGAKPIIRDANLAAQDLVLTVDDSDIDRVRELVLVDKRTNTVVTHRDVGIGVSQVLPVLVMAYGSHGKLLAMEQPEIHLHPGLQAELGDVIIEAALGDRKNTLLLETHSEHLVLRLLRRIRERTLRSDDLAVLFVEPLPGRGSRVVELKVDEDGDFIDEWPGGFFEESYREKLSGR